MIFKACLFCGIIMTALSCVSPEKLLNNKSAERLYFGKYGGFTNIPMEYVLIDNAHVYKKENDTFTHVIKLTRPQVQQLEALLKDLDIYKLDLNEPGNMTYYIRLSNVGTEKEIKWTDQTENSRVKELYKALLSTVNQ